MVKEKLRKEPFRDVFKTGSEEHKCLMAWMLVEKGHQNPDMKSAHIAELMVSGVVHAVLT
eukprot:scaffold139072_cov19-Tisochrysis_lutea.AAC.1